MTAILIFIMAALLIGAVIAGIWWNGRAGAKPSAGVDGDGTPRKSS